MKNKLLLFFSLSCFTVFSQNEYHKSYYNNGNLKQEGWLKNNNKIKYWKFYHQNGALKKEGSFKNDLPSKYWYFYRENTSKKKEGHFIRGKENKWWLFYDNEGNVNHKCQLKDNQKNGYCLLYQKRKLIKAVKYKNGKKINEWKNFSSFTKENNLKDLK